MSDLKELYEREKHVVIHGQSVRFRLAKYAILLPLLFGLYVWKGGVVLWQTLAVLLVLSLIIHFFFRYMSDGWRKSWWLYKKK